MRNRAKKHDEYRTPPDLMVATGLQLVSQVPKDLRAAALRATVETLKAFHPVRPDPDWIEMLSEIADREEASEVGERAG